MHATGMTESVLLLLANINRKYAFAR